MLRVSIVEKFADRDNPTGYHDRDRGRCSDLLDHEDQNICDFPITQGSLRIRESNNGYHLFIADASSLRDPQQRPQVDLIQSILHFQLADSYLFAYD